MNEDEETQQDDDQGSEDESPYVITDDDVVQGDDGTWLDRSNNQAWPEDLIDPSTGAPFGYEAAEADETPTEAPAARPAPRPLFAVTTPEQEAEIDALYLTDPARARAMDRALMRRDMLQQTVTIQAAVSRKAAEYPGLFRDHGDTIVSMVGQMDPSTLASGRAVDMAIMGVAITQMQGGATLEEALTLLNKGTAKTAPVAPKRVPVQTPPVQRAPSPSMNAGAPSRPAGRKPQDASIMDLYGMSGSDWANIMGAEKNRIQH